MTEKDADEIVIGRSQDFRKIYSTNTNIYTTDVDIRWLLFNERFLQEDGKWVMLSDGMVILTPECAKKALKEMEKAVDQVIRTAR